MYNKGDYMVITIFFIGLIIGFILSVSIDTISWSICNGKNKGKDTGQKNSLELKKVIQFAKALFKEVKDFKISIRSIWVIILTASAFLISFLRIGVTMRFYQAVVLDCILIIISFIDLEHRIIPNEIVIVTLIMGILFSFVDNISMISALLGMIFGGGALFLLALIPKAMGGGDIKLMFALGLFLGLFKVVWALGLAFISAAITSLILLLLKFIGRKEHIPFGPFLALGSFIAYHFL